MEIIVDFSGGTVGAFTEGEQIVRCRDCKHKEPGGDWCYLTSHEFMVEPNGFCSWGERKGDV